MVYTSSAVTEAAWDSVFTDVVVLRRLANPLAMALSGRPGLRQDDPLEQSGAMMAQTAEAVDDSGSQALLMVDSVEDLCNMALRGRGPADAHQRRLRRVRRRLKGGARTLLSVSRQSPRTSRIGLSQPAYSPAGGSLKGPPPNGGYGPANPWSNPLSGPPNMASRSIPTRQDMIDLRAIVQQPGNMPDLDLLSAHGAPTTTVSRSSRRGPPAGSDRAAGEGDLLQRHRCSGRLSEPCDQPSALRSGLHRPPPVATLGKRFASAFGYEVNPSSAR